MSAAAGSPTNGAVRWILDDRRGLYFVAGVVVVPILLTVLFTSWDGVTAEGAVRMAFASVAGVVIAMLTAWGVFVMTLRRNPGRLETLWFAGIAVAVTAFGVWSLISTGNLLLDRINSVSFEVVVGGWL